MFGIFFAILCALALWSLWRPRYYRGWGGGCGYGGGCGHGYGRGCGQWKGAQPGQPGASPDGPPTTTSAPPVSA